MSQNLRIRHVVERLGRYQPGMGIEEARSRSRSGRIIKLSSNETNFGPLPVAAAAARAALADLARYPEGEGALVRALAERHGIGTDQIVLSPGADGSIGLLSRAVLGPEDVVVHAWPSFVSYPLAAAQQGARCVAVPCVDGVHDLDAMLAAVTGRTSMVVVCNPNNPTGTTVGRDALARFLDRLPAHVICVVDEAYHEFVTDPDVPDALEEHLKRGDERVVVMRTFSKIHGLAGLRIGFAAGAPAVIDAMGRFRAAFDVTAIAAIAARAALGDVDGVRRRAALNAAQRTRLLDELREAGLDVYPSEGNFVCIEVGDGPAAAAALLAEGVVVRPLAAFGAPSRIRVTIGRPSEMRHAVRALVDLHAGRLAGA